MKIMWAAMHNRKATFEKKFSRVVFRHTVYFMDVKMTKFKKSQKFWYSDSDLEFRNNRGAQHELDKDSHDKMGAFTIDNRCHGLQNTSAGINYYAGIENVDNTWVMCNF